MNDSMTDKPSNEPARVWAVVPAAGQGKRIGGPKALLPFGASTMVQTVVATLRDGGVDGIVVVANPDIAEAVTTLLGDAAGLAINHRPDSEMIESIQTGLAELAEAAVPRAGDGCLVLPVDQPTVAAAAVRCGVDAFRASPERIVIASRHGRRGHPIIFPWSLADEVRGYPPSMGLNQLPRTHAERVLPVECADGVVFDVDTPEDYDRARS
jgi:CTP:molybdopterin cytidylyltransferase MocA